MVSVAADRGVAWWSVGYVGFARWLALRAVRQVGAFVRFVVLAPLVMVHEFTHVVSTIVGGGVPVGVRMHGYRHAHTDAIHRFGLGVEFSAVAGYTLTPLWGLLLLAVEAWANAVGARGDFVAYALVTLMGWATLLLARNVRAACAALALVSMACVSVAVSVPVAWWATAIAVWTALDAWWLAAEHMRHGREVTSDATTGLLSRLDPRVVATVFAVVSTTFSLLTVAMSLTW